MHSKEWLEGFAAFKSGWNIYDNPHDDSGRARDDWADGFCKAQADYHAELQKCRAWNGTTGGAGHGRCDKYINHLTSK